MGLKFGDSFENCLQIFASPTTQIKLGWLEGEQLRHDLLFVKLDGAPMFPVTLKTTLHTITVETSVTHKLIGVNADVFPYSIESGEQLRAVTTKAPNVLDAMDLHVMNMPALHTVMV